jgi:hypothetical protein
VEVAAAGTPVQLYAGSPMVRGKCIIVKALNTNAGTVYVGAGGMDKATLAGVSADLVAGASATYPAHEGNPLNPEELWVDADNAGDAVLVTVVGG